MVSTRTSFTRVGRIVGLIVFWHRVVCTQKAGDWTADQLIPVDYRVEATVRTFT